MALVSRREGDWDEAVAYFEQALALDPRNVEFLITAGQTYTMLRRFPAALRLHDRALDILPNDPDMMASKGCNYLVQGNLQEAAGLLSGINEQTLSEDTVRIKITQLRLERNYGEAVRLLQARQAEFHFASPHDKGRNQALLALMQSFAGDAAGAKASAEQARNTLEQLYKRQPSNEGLAATLSEEYAAVGERDPALTEAERAIMLVPRSKDPVFAPALEENLARIQTIFGENSRAISTLKHLLQTPYTWDYAPMPITPAYLRLDPFWDSLRGDPAFQKLCQEKQPPR